MDDAFRTSLLVPLAGLLVVATVIAALIYWLVICRTLYKFGARFPTGLAFWRVPRDLMVYRDICATHGKSFAMYASFLILFWFSFLVGIVLVLRLLWERTAPLS